jgi:hypothetical protein
MCTLSWLPGPDGYTLCFNRDERLTRAPAVPPAPHHSHGIQFLAPLDGDFGGTWLGVNEFGLCLSMLNRYSSAGYQHPDQPRSRGLLILDLIIHGTAREALTALEARDLEPFPPFSLVVVEPGLPARLACWDGRSLTAATHRAPGLVLTSSSVTEPEVAASRKATFASVERITEDTLVHLHRSHVPERGRRSICMHREDAETQSFSMIAVGGDAIQLMHVPDAPCRGNPLPPLALLRRAVPCPTPR